MLEVISGFIAHLGRKDLPDHIAGSLPVLIQLGHQYLLLDELARDAASLGEKVQIHDQTMLNMTASFRERVIHVLDAVTPELSADDLAAAVSKLEAVIEDYDSLKYQILKSGSSGELGMVTVDAMLQQSLLLRRVAKLAVKVSRRLYEVRDRMSENR